MTIRFIAASRLPTPWATFTMHGFEDETTGKDHIALTLGDIKAIVFYASLFPLFVDMHTPDAMDLVAVLLITVFSVGGVKVVYALLAQRIARHGNPRLQQPLNAIAGCAMIGAGAWLVTRP